MCRQVGGTPLEVSCGKPSQGDEASLLHKGVRQSSRHALQTSAANAKAKNRCKHCDCPRLSPDGNWSSCQPLSEPQLVPSLLIGSPPTCPQRPALGHAEAGSQEHGRQEPNDLSHLSCLLQSMAAGNWGQEPVSGLPM